MTADQKSKKSTSTRRSNPPPTNPRLKPKPVTTRVVHLPNPPPDRIFRRVKPISSLKERLSPYFGHNRPTQFGLSKGACQDLDIERLREIAFQANKLISDPKQKIMNYHDPHLTKDHLCQILILKKITVLADGRVTFLDS